MNLNHNDIIKINTDFSQIDLSGKLLIKARLGEDVRMFPIHNEDITYDELLLMMQRVFRGKLGTSDEVVIKYRDEDGDLITISDSSDLSFAKQYSKRALKVTLFVNGKPKPLESDTVKHLKKELSQVRNTVNKLLEKLDSLDTVGPVGSLRKNQEKEDKINAKAESPTPAVNSKPQPQVTNTNVAQTSMFDPLKPNSNQASENKTSTAGGTFSMSSVSSTPISGITTTQANSNSGSLQSQGYTPSPQSQNYNQYPPPQPQQLQTQNYVSPQQQPQPPAQQPSSQQPSYSGVDAGNQPGSVVPPQPNTTYPINYPNPKFQTNDNSYNANASTQQQLQHQQFGIYYNQQQPNVQHGFMPYQK